MRVPKIPDKIESWEHAIDLTIQLHEYTEHTKKPYWQVSNSFTPDSWRHHCPLCQYIFGNFENDNICHKCLWIKFTGYKCYNKDKHGYNYTDNEESIERLKEWKEKIKEEETNENN